MPSPVLLGPVAPCWSSRVRLRGPSGTRSCGACGRCGRAPAGSTRPERCRGPAVVAVRRAARSSSARRLVPRSPCAGRSRLCPSWYAVCGSSAAWASGPSGSPRAAPPGPSPCLWRPVAISGSIPASVTAVTLPAEKYPASANSVRGSPSIPAAASESARSARAPGSSGLSAPEATSASGSWATGRDHGRPDPRRPNRRAPRRQPRLHRSQHFIIDGGKPR